MSRPTPEEMRNAAQAARDVASNKCSTEGEAQWFSDLAKRCDHAADCLESEDR